MLDDCAACTGDAQCGRQLLGEDFKGIERFLMRMLEGRDLVLGHPRGSRWGWILVWVTVGELIVGRWILEHKLSCRSFVRPESGRVHWGKHAVYGKDL